MDTLPSAWFPIPNSSSSQGHYLVPSTSGFIFMSSLDAQGSEELAYMCMHTHKHIHTHMHAPTYHTYSDTQVFVHMHAHMCGGQRSTLAVVNHSFSSFWNGVSLRPDAHHVI